MMIRALSAEVLKIRHTLGLRLALLAPMVMVGYGFLAFWAGGEESFEAAGENAWLEFAQLVDIFWALLALPLFATLQAALVANLEHGNRQWKHLYALPVPRWAVYGAKQLSMLALMAISHAALAVFTLTTGLVLWALRPGLGFHAPLPWGAFLLPVLLVYLASWLLLALQTWVSLRSRSFVAALAVGIVLTVTGVVVVNSSWGSFYPWALPGLIVNALNKGESLPLAEFLAGSLGGVAVAALGCWDVTRRDVL